MKGSALDGDLDLNVWLPYLEYCVHGAAVSPLWVNEVAPHKEQAAKTMINDEGGHHSKHQADACHVKRRTTEAAVHKNTS